MNECRNCDGELYAGPAPYQVDQLVCRDCQRVPAVQMRILLAHARANFYAFDEAWRFAWDRIRWPHDTTHRREWKMVLPERRPPEAWRSAYAGEPSTPREKLLVHLALVAA